MHTNLDNAVNGVNYMIARKMGLTDIRPINGGACPPGNDDPSAKVQGVKGTLPEALDAEAFISMVKETFHVECALCNELLKKPVRTVAVCGGAGSFLLGDAIAAGADAFVTGEMGYHEFFGHEQQIQIVVIGHYQSEQYTSELLQEIIGERCKGVRTLIAQTNTNPIIYR
jgi:putative NIF3 family GTP cyclohydrolase 1 type 2